ncbi:MAG: AI-2E family transporter [Pseudomonadota bacterium]
MLPTRQAEKALSNGLLDVLIRAGLIAILAVASYQIFHPFLDLMLWSMILAITLYPLHLKLRDVLGHSDARAASLIVLIAIAILLVPVYLLGDSLAQSIEQSIAVVKSGNFHIPPPSDSVASWPLVGESLHGFWLQATTNLTGLLQQAAPQLKVVGLGVLGKLAGVGIGFLMFIMALIIAGIFMAYGANGSRSAQRIASRIFNPSKGPQIAELCTATVRAVAQGVVGIAFIQMFLVGGGFVVMDIPGAGLLALAVLLLGIMQLPATLIIVPVIAFVFATEGASATTIVFAIYSVVAGLADNVLKPLLLARGVAVPMPVILIGALGGMVTSGIIGLFIGPVILAVSYQLFWQWVDDAPEATESPVDQPSN